MPNMIESMHKSFNPKKIMHIKPIKTDADYRAALKEVEALMTADPNTPEGDKLDILVTLVESYEREHFPLDLPDPVEAIKFEMEQKGLTVKDLEPMIGKSNRVYEVLNRKRSLTLKMIQKLHQELGIPAESLIKQPAQTHST
jgi:HTH-type transcriptional regulator/antitoxin HigA